MKDNQIDIKSIGTVYDALIEGIRDIDQEVIDIFVDTFIKVFDGIKTEEGDKSYEMLGHLVEVQGWKDECKEFPMFACNRLTYYCPMGIVAWYTEDGIKGIDARNAALATFLTGPNEQVLSLLYQMEFKSMESRDQFITYVKQVKSFMKNNSESIIYCYCFAEIFSLDISNVVGLYFRDSGRIATELFDNDGYWLALRSTKNAFNVWPVIH